MKGVRLGISLLATSVGIGMLLIGVWLVTVSPVALLWQSPPSPGIVRALPAATQSAVIVTAPWAPLQAFLQTLTPPSQRHPRHRQWQMWLEGQGDSPVRQFWQATHLDPMRELLPWVGREVAWGKTEQGSLWVIQTRCVDQSNRFLNVLWQTEDLQGHPLAVNTYKGVQVVQFDLPGLGSVSTAALGDRYVLLATAPDLVLASIDAWERPQASLWGDPDWQEHMPKSHGGQIGWWFERQQRYLELGLSWQGITFSGVVMDVATAEAPHRPTLLKHVPKATHLLLAGSSLPVTWADQARTLPPLLWDPWQHWATQQPLPWVKLLGNTEEFALALVPVPQHRGKQPPLDWVYVATGAVPDTLTTTLTTSGWTATESVIQGKTVTTWTHPKQGKVLIAAEATRWTLSSSQSVLEAAWKGIPSRTLTAHLPIRNLGYVYEETPQGYKLILTHVAAQAPMLQQVKGLIRLS
ncbi:MAG: hypothetical protein OHK0012_02070 [Synechococcales cyanobacterium]